MIEYNADCTNCLLGKDHTVAQHTYSVRWTKALAVDLELHRKAPADNGRISRYTRNIYGA